MEDLRLTTRTYPLAIGGFDVNEKEESVRIKIVTDESVEAVMSIFSKPEETQEMKVMSAENVQQAVSGFTGRGNVFTRAEGVVVESRITDDKVQETRGNTIEFQMYKPSISKDVERNRADIDYLMMMGGEQA